MKIFEYLARLLYPPRCVSCAEILPIGQESGLCDACASVYALNKYDECGVCVHPMIECECPNRYLKRNNIHRCGKLFKYTPADNDDVTNRIIFRLKKSNSRAVAAFLAKELAPVVLRLAGKDKEKYILVGPPRSKSSLRRYGYDHIELLCEELQKITGIPYVKALRRVGKQGQQKQKTKKERVASANMSYAPVPNIDLRGKRVILVDDIVTSGATIVACAKVLRRIGAKTIHCASPGFNYQYRQIFKNW